MINKFKYHYMKSLNSWHKLKNLCINYNSTTHKNGTLSPLYFFSCVQKGFVLFLLLGDICQILYINVIENK